MKMNLNIGAHVQSWHIELFSILMISNIIVLSMKWPYYCGEKRITNDGFRNRLPVRKYEPITRNGTRPQDWTVGGHVW